MILMGGSPDKSMAQRAGQALLAHELTHVAQATAAACTVAATFDGAMPFTEEHEARSRAAVEHEVEHEGQGAASRGAGERAGKAAKAAEQALTRAASRRSRRASSS